MNQFSRWTMGSQILYREVWRGQVWTARPVTVVQDSPELVALYLCPGTRWKMPAGERESFQDFLVAQDWQLTDATWAWGDSLLLIHPGKAHAVHVMWRMEDRAFVGWYINLQEPLRCTALGFDFMDQDLDIVVAPDLSHWTWKDEDRFLRRQEIGLISARQAREIRAEGERVIARVRAKASPFSDGWQAWTPDPAWPVPGLPEGWDKL